jgi:hypothetical protein
MATVSLGYRELVVVPNGLSFPENGDFLEGILAVVSDKKFRFDSMCG